MITSAITQPITPAIRSPFGRAEGSIAPPQPPADPMQEFIQKIYGNGQPGTFFVDEPEVQGKTALYIGVDGTQPVAASGDPVGRFVDFSGNGIPAIAANSSARAIYPGMVYDGSNDSYQLALNNLFRESPGALAGAVFSVNEISSASKEILGATVAPDIGSDLFILYVTGSEIRVGGRRNSGDSFEYATVGTVSANTLYVVVAYVNWQSGEITIRLNGEEFMAPFQTPGLTDSNQRGVAIGSRYTGTAPFLGKIGATMLRDGLATAADITTVSEYFAYRAGVVL